MVFKVFFRVDVGKQAFDKGGKKENVRYGPFKMKK